MKPLIPLFLVVFTGFTRGASFEEANAAFASGDYAKAAAAYEEVISSGGPSAARLYNLGNARFRLKEYGPAILAFERAALLSPRDADIRANLKLARDAAKSPGSEPERRWWEVPMHWLSLHEWSWLAAAGSLSLAAAVIVAAFSKRHRARAFGAAAMALITGALSAAALIHRNGERQRAILIAATPRLLLSPFNEADPSETLSPGTMVRVEKSERGWHYVSTLSGGIKGWLPEAEAGLLMAP